MRGPPGWSTQTVPAVLRLVPLDPLGAAQRSWVGWMKGLSVDTSHNSQEDC